LKGLLTFRDVEDSESREVRGEISGWGGWEVKWRVKFVRRVKFVGRGKKEV
jgi:hypothetical protein